MFALLLAQFQSRVNKNYRDALELDGRLPSERFSAITTAGNLAWKETPCFFFLFFFFFWIIKAKVKLPVHGGDKQGSEVVALKPKSWQASVRPWLQLLSIFCASVLCVRRPASSDLLLRSAIQFGGSVPLRSSPVQPPAPSPRKVFGPHCGNNAFQ